MADIFLSYASEDASRASELASALEFAGWSVWWDRRILPGQTFDDVISRELAACLVVVVLWSTHSIASDWVKEEIEDANRRRRLVPVFIEDVVIPLGYRRIQAAPLVNWRGDRQHDGFLMLCSALSSFVRPGVDPHVGSASTLIAGAGTRASANPGAPATALDSKVSGGIEARYQVLVSEGFVVLHSAEVEKKRTTPKSGRYRIRIWIESIERIRPLKDILSVTYHLWHDFNQPVVKRANLDTEFDIWLNVYGEFPVLALVETMKGEQIVLQRFIDLPGRPPD